MNTILKAQFKKLWISAGQWTSWNPGAPKTTPDPFTLSQIVK
jgi:hypothetical protein